ncbi:YidH family protein [Modicisalibacter luteus]|uniref:YidH family protein n=1 Tax=Modicisalibacter luteus TaxID=453962 RepID=A0ABV7M3A7_9GAMM|nr:DUF202 domain-containing protein [Halomonas lutea]
MAQNKATDTFKEATEMAQLASDRTVLASERTYASWLRTGCAALIAGLAVMRFMADVLNDWETQVITFLLVTFSIFCFVIATWRLRQLQKYLPRSEIPHLPFSMSAGMSAMLTLASLFALFALWQMNGHSGQVNNSKQASMRPGWIDISTDLATRHDRGVSKGCLNGSMWPPKPNAWSTAGVRHSCSLGAIGSVRTGHWPISE